MPPVQRSYTLFVENGGIDDSNADWFGAKTWMKVRSANKTMNVVEWDFELLQDITTAVQVKVTGVPAALVVPGVRPGSILTRDHGPHLDRAVLQSKWNMMERVDGTYKPSSIKGSATVCDDLRSKRPSIKALGYQRSSLPRSCPIKAVRAGRGQTHYIHSESGPKLIRLSENI